MKNLLYVLVFVFLSACKSPITNFENYEKEKQHEEYVEAILHNHDAKSDEYSLVTFTYGYYNTDIILLNRNDTIYKGNLKSDESMGFSKIIRIKNNEDIYFFDAGSQYSFKLKKENNKRYKFIYIGKNKNNRRPYTIDYTNTMRAFK